MTWRTIIPMKVIPMKDCWYKGEHPKVVGALKLRIYGCFCQSLLSLLFKKKLFSSGFSDSPHALISFIWFSLLGCRLRLRLGPRSPLVLVGPFCLSQGSIDSHAIHFHALAASDLVTSSRVSGSGVNPKPSTLTLSSKP